MQINLDENPSKMSLRRKIIYVLIIVICIISILIGAYIQVFRNNNTVSEEGYAELSLELSTRLENEFSDIFKNNINKNTNFNMANIEKIKESDELIANQYVNTDREDNKYNFNVNIPYININSIIVRKYNNEMQSVFKQKALDIIKENQNNNTVYTVEYTAYINGNILSLVIRSTLKEGSNAQRTMIQTYNYDLEKDRAVTIDNLLDMKGITSNYAESKVRDKIKDSQEKVEELKKLGYDIFDRDYKSALYRMQNTLIFFLGDQGGLYLVYPYGNQNYTSEIDVIVL